MMYKFNYFVTYFMLFTISILAYEDINSSLEEVNNEINISHLIIDDGSDVLNNQDTHITIKNDNTEE